MIVHTKTAIERMLARKVVDEDGCWVWPGATSQVPAERGGGGYGQVRDEKRGKLLMVHRVSFEHFNGPIPDGHQVEHACHTADEDCPGLGCKHRRCWNPEHLVALEHRENSTLGRSPNMRTFREGVCKRGHVLTDENVDTWVRPSGTVRRSCAPCARESQRRRRAARKAR